MCVGQARDRRFWHCDARSNFSIPQKLVVDVKSAQDCNTTSQRNVETRVLRTVGSSTSPFVWPCLFLLCLGPPIAVTRSADLDPRTVLLSYAPIPESVSPLLATKMSGALPDFAPILKLGGPGGWSALRLSHQKRYGVHDSFDAPLDHLKRASGPLLLALAAQGSGDLDDSCLQR